MCNVVRRYAVRYNCTKRASDYVWTNSTRTQHNPALVAYFQSGRTTGRGRSAMAEQPINLVQSYFRWDLRRSIGQAERDPSIPNSRIRKILKTLIHVFPYKIVRVQRFRDNYGVDWVRLAEWFKLKMTTDTNVLRRIAFLDGCVSHLSGITNTRNTRIWETENLGQYRYIECTVKK